MEIRLEIQGQLPSFIYPTDGQTNLIKMISSKTISLTLPAIPLSTPGESVATSIKISIHTPAYGAPELRSLTSQINILCEGKLLAQVPMVARVGQVKLQTLKASKIPVLNCTPNGSWFDHSVPMMNVGNIQMTISLELAGPSTVGKFQLEQSLMILQPGKEYLGHFKFKPLELGEEELILRCTVQPNGTTYEVPIRISSKQPSLDKEDNIKLPLVQLGKLSLQPTCSSPRALKSTVFPVEADKSFMNWISIPLGASEEQILTLKNALSEPISLTLLIRDSELFKVKDKNDEYKRSIEVESLPGNGTLSVRVAFQPTEKKSSLDLGKLIIKPRLGVSGKIYKATIMLQGNSGAPEFMFSGFGDEVNGKQSLFLGQLGEKPIVKSLSIRNKGSGPGFVSCMALGHHGALSEAIRFDKPQAAVVLYPNESTLIRFTVDPTRVPMGDKNQVFIGFIHVYTGSELARSAMKKAAPKASPSLKLKIQSSTFGGGLLPNFEEGFDGEREAFMGSVSYFDVKNFYKTARKMVVELSGSALPRMRPSLSSTPSPLKKPE
ncbi:Uncharacterized protein FKW44_018349 [Caligus rogercresseyi]|uniref:Centrosomal protein of 192 kDa n=1 Tax=Caligus rogercresseyi TaxID=217165 RepID=A0A7T8JWQ6_CALRO|nr:Uncharacterized protein FKW44_018349 [Caligus rogercresseyi]